MSDNYSFETGTLNLSCFVAANGFSILIHCIPNIFLFVIVEHITELKTVKRNQ